MRKYQTGDVVMLKSGGPLMTVIQYEEDKIDFEPDDLDDEEPGIDVCWFPQDHHESGDLQFDTFDEGLLKKIEK